jgi:hypothetical protein
MKKRLVLIGSLLLSLALVSGVLWSSSKSLAQKAGAARDGQQGSAKDPFVQLNQKTRSAKQGNGNTGAGIAKDDRTVIREIADVVVDNFSPVAAPDGAKEALKDRLVAAELGYRKKGKGIPEANIVKTVNELVERIGAPRYAGTNIGQVRFVRTSLMGGLPFFINQESPTASKENNKSMRSSINKEMSPLEATFVTMILVQQKMNNEDFQLEPREWIARLQQKKLERWQAFRDGRAFTQKQDGPHLSKRQPNPKSDEIARRIAEAAATMSSDELRNFADHSLDTLGIDRQGER